MELTKTDLLALLVALSVPLAVAAAGGAITARSLRADGWYDALRKPPWNPPRWVFAPVWTALYLAMGAASWLMWRARAEQPGAGWALVLYGAQLALNLLWSVLFFGRRRVAAALVDLTALWLTTAAAAVMFSRLDRAAGSLMVPYLAWLTFALALNAEVWRLNRQTGNRDLSDSGES